MATNLYGRLSTLLYIDVRTYLEEILETRDATGIIDAHRALSRIVDLHEEELEKIDCDEQGFLGEISNITVDIVPEHRILAQSSIEDIAVEIQRALEILWEINTYVEENTYRMAYDGETGKYKVAIINADWEKRRELLGAGYGELLDDVEHVDFADPSSIIEVIAKTEYLVSIYEDIELGEWRISIEEIDKILVEIKSEIAREIEELSSWLPASKEIVKNKERILSSYKTEINTDMTGVETKAGATLDAFVFVDELIDKITKAFGTFKAWLRSRLEEKLSWIKWPFGWVKDAIIDIVMGYLCGPTELFIKILNTEASKMILSAMYLFIKAGYDALKIIGAGIAYLIFKGIQKYLEYFKYFGVKPMAWVLDLFPFPDKWKKTIRKVIEGTYNKLCNWAGDSAIYMLSVAENALEDLKDAVLFFFKPIMNGIKVIVDAVRSELGDFLLNVHELLFELYARFYAPLIMGRYGYDSESTNVWWFIAERLFYGDEPVAEFYFYGWSCWI